MRKDITLKEIKTHNKRDNCWLLAKGKVYNASKFLDDHPAHLNRIMKYAGADVTEDFNFHTKSQKKIWEKYLIGKVITENKSACIVS